MIQLYYGILLSSDKEYSRFVSTHLEISLILCIKLKKQVSEKIYSVIPFGLNFIYVNACQQFWKCVHQIAKQWVLLGVGCKFEESRIFAFVL